MKFKNITRNIALLTLLTATGTSSCFAANSYEKKLETLLGAALISIHFIFGYDALHIIKSTPKSKLGKLNAIVSLAIATGILASDCYLAYKYLSIPATHNGLDFWNAIFNKDLHSVRELIKKNAYKFTERTGDSKLTPLHYATLYGNLEALQLLLNANYNANETNSLKETPLHLVASDRRIIATLLNHGANINAQNDIGMTPLYSAIKEENINPDIILLFLQHGANVNPENKCIEGSPLHYCVKNMYLNDTSNHLKTAQMLIDHGANLNAHDAFNGTPLYMCAHNGPLYNDMAQILLENGANPNIPFQGKKPIDLAIEQRNFELIKMLLKFNCDTTTAPLYAEATALHTQQSNDMIRKYHSRVEEHSNEDTICFIDEKGATIKMPRANVLQSKVIQDMVSDTNYTEQNLTQVPVTFPCEIIKEIFIAGGLVDQALTHRELCLTNIKHCSLEKIVTYLKACNYLNITPLLEIITHHMGSIVRDMINKYDLCMELLANEPENTNNARELATNKDSIFYPFLLTLSHLLGDLSKGLILEILQKALRDTGYPVNNAINLFNLITTHEGHFAAEYEKRVEKHANRKLIILICDEKRINMPLNNIKESVTLKNILKDIDDAELEGGILLGNITKKIATEIFRNGGLVDQATAHTTMLRRTINQFSNEDLIELACAANFLDIPHLLSELQHQITKNISNILTKNIELSRLLLCNVRMKEEPKQECLELINALWECIDGLPQEIALPILSHVEMDWVRKYANMLYDVLQQKNIIEEIKNDNVERNRNSRFGFLKRKFKEIKQHASKIITSSFDTLRTYTRRFFW
jgi:ankyrin repeat protein